MTKKTDQETAIEESTRDFELAVKKSGEGHYTLSLYISGLTANSRKAIENVKKICDEYLEGRYELEIIDVYQQPELAKDAQIVAAPTLVKELPLPLRKFIGDMSMNERLLRGLDLKKKE